MTSVSANSLVVTRSSYPAIANGTFDLPEQHCTVVTGTNGSGKTTLLKAIAGIIPPERGEITISDGIKYVTSKELRLLKRKVSYVGHSALYMRHITVSEHLELTSQLSAGLSSDIPEFVMSPDLALEIFKLADRKNVRVENLSAGQQRRLHLASAFVRSTPLLCIDEPHASLDDDSKDLIDSVISVQFEKGRAFIIATHDPDRLAKIATHFLEIKSGVVEAVIKSSGGKK